MNEQDFERLFENYGPGTDITAFRLVPGPELKFRHFVTCDEWTWHNAGWHVVRAENRTIRLEQNRCQECGSTNSNITVGPIVKRWHLRNDGCAKPELGYIMGQSVWHTLPVCRRCFNTMSERERNKMMDRFSEGLQALTDAVTALQDKQTCVLHEMEKLGLSKKSRVVKELLRYFESELRMLVLEHQRKGGKK